MQHDYIWPLSKNCVGGPILPPQGSAAKIFFSQTRALQMRCMQKIGFLVSKLWMCPLPPQPCASWTPLWYNYMHTHGIAPLCFKYHSNKTPCTIFMKIYIQYLPSIIFQSLFICDCKTNNSFNGNWKFSRSILAQFFFDVFIVSFLNLKHMKESKKYIFLLLI